MKILKLADGSTYELSPLTFEEFKLTDLWQGYDDMAYEHFLNHNGLKDISDFSIKDLIGSTIQFTNEHREYKLLQYW